MSRPAKKVKIETKEATNLKLRIDVKRAAENYVATRTETLSELVDRLLIAEIASEKLKINAEQTQTDAAIRASRKAIKNTA